MVIENKLPNYIIDDEFLNEQDLSKLADSIVLLPFELCPTIGAARDGVLGIDGSNFLDRLIVVSEPNPEEDNHPLLPIANELVDKFCTKHGFKLLDFFRTRVNLTPLSKDFRPLIPHVDLRNKYKHYILLLFLNDSDGDTIMYDLKVDGDIHAQEELSELKRFSPKAGRAVLFDGDYFHAWEHPKDHDFRLSMIANISVEKIAD
jgi:hypothetical protein